MACVFSPDGKALLTGGRDGTARLWDAATGKPLVPPLVHQDTVTGLAFSPDGRPSSPAATTARRGSGTPPPASPRRATAPPGPGQRGGVQPGREDRPHRQQRRPARLWDAASGDPSSRPCGTNPRSQPWCSAPTASASSPAASTARRGSGTPPPPAHQPAFGPSKHARRPRGLQPGRQDRPHRQQRRARRGSGTPPPASPSAAPLTHQGSVDAVAFSPDGKTVLTGSHDGTARLWDAATGQPLGRATDAPGRSRRGVQPRRPRGPHRQPRRTARAVGRVTGMPLGLPLEHKSDAMAAAFSPDGKAVLTGSATARPGSGTPPPASPSAAMTHQGSVEAVAFSPDGKAVLTGSADGTARLWDAATGLPLAPPLVHEAGSPTSRSAPTARPSSPAATTDGAALGRRLRPALAAPLATRARSWR